MYIPSIEKLRRFSLVMGMVLLTYSIAGISLEPNAQVVLLGLAFKVSRPELLPVGFALGSFYGLVSYYYYGFMLAKSPYRIRRDIIDGLNSWEPPNFVVGKKVSFYFGPTEFETSPWRTDREVVETYIKNFQDAFPKVANARASAVLVSEQNHDEDGNLYSSYAAKITIPVRCRIASIFQDIDYSSPIWLNCIALFAFYVNYKGA